VACLSQLVKGNNAVIFGFYPLFLGLIGQERLVASPKTQTGFLPSDCFSSGSRVRLPKSITLLTDFIILTSFLFWFLQCSCCYPVGDSY
jgi:hypothetical protein